MSLDPLYFAVSWVLLRWHKLFSLIGVPEQSGLNWLLSIGLLVLTIRLILLPVAVRQLRHQRRMQSLQPQLQAIRDRYPNDAAARRREFATLDGANPLFGCLPMLLQVPVFLSLLQVLRHLANSAGIAEAIRTGQPVSASAHHRLTLYGFSQHQTLSGAWARMWGAPLAGSIHRGAYYVQTVLHGSYPATQVAVLIVVFVSACASYLSQRRLPAASPAASGNAATINRLMPWLIPGSVLISGLFFPLGLLWYWCVSNVGTLVQQLYLNRFHPHPELAERQVA